MADKIPTTIPAAEEWRPIDGYPLYGVSNLGRVRREVGGAGTRAGKILKPALRVGYPSVSLREGNGKRKAAHVHVLVCTAFNGPRPSAAHQVRHLNGIRADNVDANLKWGTAQENSLDAIVHGTGKTGGDHHFAKISNDQARALRAEYRAARGSNKRLPIGVLGKIAAKYGIDRTTVGCIIRRETHRYTQERES